MNGKPSTPAKTRTKVFTGLVLLVLVSCTPQDTTAPVEQDPVTRILKEVTVVDPAVTTRFFRFEAEPERPFDPGRLVEAGLDVAGHGVGSLVEVYQVQNFHPYLYTQPPRSETVFRGVFQGADSLRRFLWELDALHRAAEQHQEDLEIALTADDVGRIREAGKLALIVGLDTGEGIEDLSTLRIFHRLGVRKLELVHAFPTAWADACSGSMDDDEPGLEPFGEEVVRECNRLGIIVDVSHASDDTFWDTIRATSKPIIASHSGARSVADAVRNLTDDQLKALAENGGMIAVGALYDPAILEPIAKTGHYEHYLGVQNYLTQRYTEPYELAIALRDPAQIRQAREALGLPTSEEHQTSDLGSKRITRGATVAGTLNHIDYIVNLIGIDHVGIGTDIDMRGTDYIEIWRQLTQGLLDRGYSREDMEKILGGNFLRVFRANSPSE